MKQAGEASLVTRFTLELSMGSGAFVLHPSMSFVERGINTRCRLGVPMLVSTGAALSDIAIHTTRTGIPS